MNTRSEAAPVEPFAETSSPVDDLLCFDLYAASRAMTSLYRPMLAPLDLTYPQYLVLQVLTRRGPSGVGDLGQVLRLDYGTTTPLLRRLEERGLITRLRAVSDQRAVLITLTDTGRELAPDLDQVRCGIQQAIGIREDELLQLQHTLRRLTAEISA